MRASHAQATRIVMTQLVSPAESSGPLNICSGGTVLSWIDICAGLAAKTLARGPAVTASVDAVHFLRPCHVGSVVIIAAMVNRTFKSSMEVGVRVEEECVRTGARHHCCRCGRAGRR
jgi:acyl-CoA hydrolase